MKRIPPLGNGLGIPSASLGRRHKVAVDMDFERRKHKLAKLIEPLSRRDMMRFVRALTGEINEYMRKKLTLLNYSITQSTATSPRQRF